MDNASPLRIASAPASPDKVNRLFVGIFFVFGANFVLAAFYHVALIPFVVGFPIYLLAWRSQLRRVSRAGWTLDVTEHRLVMVSRERSIEIARADAGRIRLRAGRSWVELQVVDAVGRVTLQERLNDPEPERIIRILRENDWPPA